MSGNQPVVPSSRGKAENLTTGLPSGPVCFYCKCRGYIKAECRALQKKNTKALAVTSANSVDTSFPKEYTVFISGSVSLLDSSEEIPVSILRDTGAAQSLILKIFVGYVNGREVMLQGVELGLIQYRSL